LLASGRLPAQTPPAQDPPGVNLSIDGDLIALSVNETEGLALIDFIKLTERITDRVFVYSPQEVGNPTNGNITFIGEVELRRENFFSFFQTMLYIRGFACVLRTTGDSEVVEIVAMTGPKRQELTSSARYVPPDEVENYANQTGVTILTTVPLKYINANTAQTQLRPFFAQGGAGGVGLTPGSVGNGRALLLQGFGPQVYSASQLLRLVDVEPESPDTESLVVPLVNSTAEELEPILKQVMDERARSVQQAGAGGDLAAAQAEQLTVIGLSSLNGILLSGPKSKIWEAQTIIAQIDLPFEIGGGDIHVIQLKNVLAEDLATTLRNFINEDLAAEQQQQTAAAGQAGARRPRKTVIVPHPESNSILVSATQTKFKQLENMVQELDERQPQVLIETAVVELTTSELDRLGVELGLIDIGGDDFTRPFGFTSFGASTFQDTDDDGIPDSRLPDFSNPLQGVTGGIISSDDFAIPVLINALQQTTNANVLSLPSVVVNNNEEASVSTQEDRPTQTSNQGTATTSSGFGGFEGAGVEMRISPSISSNDYLRLNIELSVSRFLTPYDPDSVTPGVKALREITTAVTLPSGNTMVLGGVIEDRTSESRSGIPFLMDIPLLGFLFSAESKDNNKTNLYFFVTPNIIDEDDFSDLEMISFRKKLEAGNYIGQRRLQIVDQRRGVALLVLELVRQALVQFR
jgi:general secretion pathway protein D